MNGAIRVLLGVAMLVTASACDLVDQLGGPGVHTVVHKGETVEVGGVPNEPTTAKVVAARFDTPMGVIALETYDSRVGPCFDAVFPDGRRQANCQVGTGIDPARPVIGGPDGSPEAVNGGGWNAGRLDESGIGMVRHGFAHPTVAAVTVEPDDGSTATAFPVVRAPNVAGMFVYLAWSAADVERYTLAGYDAGGCLLDAEPVPFDGGLPGDAARDCSRRIPDELDVVEALPDR